MATQTTARRPAEHALLRLLQRQGTLPDAEAGRLTELAATSDLPIQELLAREGVVTERELAELLARTLRLRFVERSAVSPDPAAAEVLSESVATQYGVVPVRIDGGTIEVATANPLDFEALKAVEFATGRRVRAIVTTRAEAWEAPPAPAPEPAPEPAMAAEPAMVAAPASPSEPVSVAEPPAPEPEPAPAQLAAEPPREDAAPADPAPASPEALAPPEPPAPFEAPASLEPPAPFEPPAPPEAEAPPPAADAWEPMPLAVVSPEQASLSDPDVAEELRAAMDELRNEQRTAAADTRAATAEARVAAEQAVERATAAVEALREQLADFRREQYEQARAARVMSEQAVERAAAAVEPLRAQIAELRRDVGEQARLAADAGAEASRAREAAAEVGARVAQAGQPSSDLGETRAAVAAVRDELARLRAFVEDEITPRIAAAEGAIPDVELLRLTVDELSRPQAEQHEASARASADAARAMEQADRALRRITEATLPLAEELGAVRAACGELRASHGRLEAAIEQQAAETEKRTAALITGRMRSVAETVEEVRRWHELQKSSAANARLETALTRQQVTEALRRVEALASGPSADDLRGLRDEIEAMRAEQRTLEPRVEERTDTRIRSAIDPLAAQLRDLRGTVASLGAGLRELAQTVGWIATVNRLAERVAELTELPARLLARLRYVPPEPR
jgi:chromosome segregation ATPase